MKNKGCKCEHWETCPTCRPEFYDTNGNWNPPKPKPDANQSLAMVLALAEIDTRLGLEDDGCNSTMRTLTAIDLLHAAHRDDLAEIERLNSRSVTELCADHENLRDYIAQLEDERDAARRESAEWQKSFYTMASMKAERDAAVKALTDVGTFLDHCWRDVPMNDFSFEWLERMIAAIDAARGGV